MRAVAALLIITFHYLIFPWGWVGVQFFFVISGFFISDIILRGKEEYENKNPKPFFTNFYKRRVMRLFPLYFGYVSLLLLIYFFFNKPETLKTEWIWLVTYTINFRWLFNSYTFHMTYGHLWSLALEWQFYLIWPFLLWKIPRKYKWKIFLWLIPSGMVVRVLGYLICNHIKGLVGYNGNAKAQALAPYVLPFSHIDAFVFGALLCNKKVREFLSRPVIVYSCLGVTLMVGLLLVALIPDYSLASLGWPSNLPLAYQWVWGYTLLNLTSAVIIAALIEQKNMRLFAFTRSKFLQYLGKISYGIYVYHPMIIFGMMAFRDKIGAFPGRNIVELIMVMTLTCIIAHFSYILWEKRFLKSKKAAHTDVDLPSVEDEKKSKPEKFCFLGDQ